MRKAFLIVLAGALGAGAAPAGQWVKSPGNPVLGGERLGTCFDVNVVTNGPAPYTMYFSWRPKKAIALVRSADAARWSQEPEICLEANPASGWEDDLNRSCTVFRDGVWHMWYTGQANGGSKIGYATSKDGVTFERVTPDPVLVPEKDFEKLSVMNPYVRWDAARKVWRMWYAAGETYEPNVLCYAESPDGVKWTKDIHNPIFGKGDPLAWDRDRVGACEVHPLPDGRWAMFYIGYSDVNTARIGCAFSDDGIVGWRRHDANPLVSPDLCTWDSCACYKPSVVRDAANDRWLMWYNGRSGSAEYVGCAVHKGLDLNAPVADLPDPKAVLKTHVARFNARDEELYTNAIPNAAAAEFLAANVPLFACPDVDIERTYCFRWWTYRKHLRRTPAGGWAVSEFLPNVGWAGPANTIACPFGHHVREGRWLRDACFIDNYIDFMLAYGRINGPGAYICWPAAAALERARVTGDNEFLKSHLGAFVRNYEAWARGWTVIGLSLRDVKSATVYDGPAVRTGFRPERGLFDYAGDREGSEFALSVDGARPFVNAAMWAEAAAIAEIARLAGQQELSERFARNADEIARNVRERLWNRRQEFFTALSVDGKLDDVCELNGYAPFYFGMPLSGCESAWDRLADTRRGFLAPAGLTFPARNTKGFDPGIDPRLHECLWNGPSWPYATTIALTGLYRTFQSGHSPAVRRDEFAALLSQYAGQHRLTRPWDAGGETVPWIDENLQPFTGEWIARRVIQLRDEKSGKVSLPRERGKDYNHSAFCDLVIAGLVGFVPGDEKGFMVDPLAPPTWDYFVLDNLRYRGHDVSIRWHRGKTGLTVTVDGAVAAHSDALRKVYVSCPSRSAVPER